MTEVGDKFTKKLDFSHTGIGKIEVGILVQRESIQHTQVVQWDK